MAKTTVQVSDFTLDIVKELKQSMGCKSADEAILMACQKWQRDKQRRSK